MEDTYIVMDTMEEDIYCKGHNGVRTYIVMDTIRAVYKFRLLIGHKMY